MKADRVPFKAAQSEGLTCTNQGTEKRDLEVHRRGREDSILEQCESGESLLRFLNRSRLCQ